MKPPTLVCLATQEWDAHWTPVQQVMVRLAPRYPVVYIEPFHPPLARLKRSNHVLRRRVAQLREVRPGLLVYRPAYPYAPFNMRSGLAEAINGQLSRLELRRLLRRLGIERAWLWAFFAQTATVLDLPFERVLYDCVDDWPSFFTDARERRFVTRIDEMLFRRADLVFVGSRALHERKAGLNPRTFVVNHAADVDHFAKAADPATPVPADLAVIPRPRVGFVGMMDPLRFDADLVARLARRPDRHVVLIGGFVHGGDRVIPRGPNIHLLGMKPVSDLPGYLKGLDVCLMPYRRNETTRYIYPLKLHEYLATGKPIVATTIPAVEDLDKLLYLAEDAPGFVDQVEAALLEADPGLSQARQAFARQHDWQAHVARKLELIDELLLR